MARAQAVRHEALAQRRLRQTYHGGVHHRGVAPAGQDVRRVREERVPQLHAGPTRHQRPVDVHSR